MKKLKSNQILIIKIKYFYYVIMNKLVDGILVLMTDEEEAARNAEVAAAQAKEAANDYKVKRAEQYASWQEQMDMQYWDSVNGTTTWRDHVAKVKSDNPKP